MRSFLRDYVDNADSKSSKARRTRKRVYDNTKFAAGENEAPVNAPKWTRSGYTGSLKSLVEKQIPHHSESDNQKSDSSKFFKYREPIQEETTQEEPFQEETTQEEPFQEDSDHGGESGESDSEEESSSKESSDKNDDDDEGGSNKKERIRRSKSVVSSEYDSNTD